MEPVSGNWLCFLEDSQGRTSCNRARPGLQDWASAVCPQGLLLERGSPGVICSVSWSEMITGTWIPMRGGGYRLSHSTVLHLQDTFQTNCGWQVQRKRLRHRVHWQTVLLLQQGWDFCLGDELSRQWFSVLGSLG